MTRRVGIVATRAMLALALGASVGATAGMARAQAGGTEAYESSSAAPSAPEGAVPSSATPGASPSSSTAAAGEGVSRPKHPTEWRLQGKYRWSAAAELLRVQPAPGGTTFSTGLGLAPLAYGYMLTDSLFLGGILDFGFEWSTSMGTSASLQWRLGVMLEYLFLKHAVRPFVSIDVGFGGSTLIGFPMTFALSGGLGGGIHFFLDERFSIDPGVHVRVNDAFSPLGSGFSFEASLRLGMSVYF